MAIIKKSKIIDKGTIDLKQEAYNPPKQEDIREKVPSLRPSQLGRGERGEGGSDQFQKRENFDGAKASADIMDDAYEKAARITQASETEAQELLENTQLEVDKIRADAIKEGFEEGKREGESHVAEYMTEALETLNSAIKERKKIIKDAESELVRLALKIAEQIVRSEISLHKDVVLNIVTEAINKIGDRENIIIKVNREDAEYIKQYKNKISGIVDGVKTLSISEDSQVEQGGCVVETHLGYVDARISTKLFLLEEALKKAQSSV